MAVKCKKQSLYAVHHGDFAGQLIAFIEKREHSYNFLAMPDMKNIEVPEKDLNEGIEKDIVQFVEILPDDIFEVVREQYKKNENTND